MADTVHSFGLRRLVSSRPSTEHVPWQDWDSHKSFSFSSLDPNSRASSLLFEPVKETSVIKRDTDPSTGRKLINQYLIIKQLGRGVHGKVKLVRHMETNELWALKIVEKKAKRLYNSRLSHNYRADHSPPSDSNRSHNQNPHLDKIRREIAILKKCVHPHVVRLKEVIDDPNAEKIYLVLEYLAGGDIKWHDYSVPQKPLLSMQTARLVFRDVVCGLEYLHHQGIVHRDIKPANLLWTSDHRVKISDFGVSVFIPPTPTATPTDKALINNELELAKTAGSPAFFAPEVCGVVDEFLPQAASTPNLSRSNSAKIREKRSATVGKAIDVWALGVTLYCLVFGNVPFMGDTEFELFNVICKQPLTFPKFVDDVNKLDQELVRDLLTKILEKDPKKRISLVEIKNHPWTTADLTSTERETWFRETDPKIHFGEPVTVTEDEVNDAVNLMGKIKDRIRKISSSISNMAANLTVLRRRTKSLPSVTIDNIQVMSTSPPPRPSTAQSNSKPPQLPTNKPTSLMLTPILLSQQTDSGASYTSKNSNRSSSKPIFIGINSNAVSGDEVDFESDDSEDEEDLIHNSNNSNNSNNNNNNGGSRKFMWNQESGDATDEVEAERKRLLQWKLDYGAN